MKHNLNETENNWSLWKKCKNMTTKQEITSDSTFKTWPFSSDFNFACKEGRVTTVPYKYYCSLVVSPTSTCKRVNFMKKVKSDSTMHVSGNFCYCSFLLSSIFTPFIDIQLKQLNPFCWAYPQLIFFRVN